MGIRMVADFFEMDGWNSHYLGANTPSRNIIGAAAEEKADLLLLSVTMISHLDHLRDVISKIRKNDKTKNIRIIVGGYPFKVDGSLWRKVGADASARNAQEAVSIANAM
jgi:methanogenic corrinoid protein MtbC1